MESPIKVLGGRWSSAVEKTVNVLESTCVRDRVAERGIVVESEVGGERVASSYPI